MQETNVLHLPDQVQGQVARLATQKPGRVPDFGPLTEGPRPTSSPGSLPAPRVVCRCSLVGFDRQWSLAELLNKVASKFVATNAPDPLHWHQNSCFGAFQTVSLLHESRCKTGRTGAINAQVCKTKLRQNFSRRTHPIHSIGPKTHILGRFRPFYYCTKVNAKQAELAPLTPKFAKRSCFGIFRNE
jgi:hypothetical protein